MFIFNNICNFMIYLKIKLYKSLIYMNPILSVGDRFRLPFESINEISNASNAF